VSATTAASRREWSESSAVGEHTRQQFCSEYLVILAFLGRTRDTRRGQEPRERREREREKEIVETRKRQWSGELGMM